MIDHLFRFAALAALPLALAACGQPAPEPEPAPAEKGAPPPTADASAPTPPVKGTSAPPTGDEAPSLADAAELPEPFRGRWDASAAACAGRRGEMRLDVEPDRLRFYESVGRVAAVRRADDDSVRVDLAFEGEGERWTDTRTLRLLPDGRLSVATADGSTARVRCD